MKSSRRNTRAVQNGYATPNNTQDEQEERNDVVLGSDEENHPDGVVNQSSNDESLEEENVESEEAEEQTEETDDWREESDLPDYPNIPRFNGPKFEANSIHSRKIFNLVNADTFSLLQWFLEYLPA